MQNNNAFIIRYEDVDENTRELIGAKAQNVARCYLAGLPVPEGIIVTKDAFRSFMAGNDLSQLFRQIEALLGDAKRIIVRSSATDEDKANASYAGQYRSLPCENKARVIRIACETCWLSAGSERAEAYREVMGGKTIQDQQPEMGLLVQKLVDASSAGVCFTVDPQNAGGQVYVINAVYGLCSVLVDDEVVSDLYQYDVGNKQSISIVAGKQTHWRSPKNQGSLLTLPGDLVGKTVLGSDQIARVAQLAYKASQLLNAEADIEWAFEDHSLFLLQARPITSLTKCRQPECWTRDNVADVIPDVITPLTWSIVDDATNKGFNTFVSKIGVLTKPVRLFELFDGRAYFNQTAYANMLAPFTQYRRKFKRFLQVVWRYQRLIFVSGRHVAHLQRFFPNVLKTVSTETSALRIRRLKTHLEDYMTVHVQIVGLLELAFLVMRAVVKRFMPENNQVAVIDGIVKGLGKIESAFSAKPLKELAELIQQDRALTETVLSAPVQSVPRILCERDGPYGEKWRDFLEKFGHSSLKEFEIYYPRWNEDPSFIVEVLKRHLCDTGDSSRANMENDLWGKRLEAEKLLFRSSPFVYYLPLKFYVYHIRKCSIWRELLKQRIVRIMGEIRKAALSFGTEQGIVPREDVFFMSLSEMLQYDNYSISKDLVDKVAKRKNTWERSSLEPAFREIRVYPDGRQRRIPYAVDSGECMKGIPLSSGQYVGKAKIILDPADVGAFNRGDVLVAPSTNPSWTPIFVLAGAIVTDMGNYLSHGAIVARELGIPAVGNLFGATKQIKDGEVISVDGDHGTVQIAKLSERN